jgi:hypothetical protein
MDEAGCMQALSGAPRRLSLSESAKNRRQQLTQELADLERLETLLAANPTMSEVLEIMARMGLRP